VRFNRSGQPVVDILDRIAGPTDLGNAGQVRNTGVLA
jgi:hypothetical protein